MVSCHVSFFFFFLKSISWCSIGIFIIYKVDSIFNLQVFNEFFQVKGTE